MLIENFRSAWKLATIWVGSAAVAFGLLPSDTQAAVLKLLHVPQDLVPAIIGIAVIVARVIKQSGVLDPKGK